MGKIIVTLLCIPFVTALRGWVAAWLWLWFAVPFGAPAIGVWGALGLSCLISAFWDPVPNDDGDFMVALLARFMQPMLVLLIGFGIHLCWLHTGYTPPRQWGRT